MQRFLKNLKRYFIPHLENDYKPRFFAIRSVLALSTAIVGLFLLAVVQHVAILNGSNILATVVSSTLVDITNDDRAENGLRTLSYNPVLAHAAQLKADDMAAKSYFAHTSPEGVTPWHWLEEAGYTFSYAGENLAVNFSDSIDVGEAWMNSPGHRANILNDRFTEIGIASAEGVYEGQPTVFVVQFFGKPAKVQVAQAGESVVTRETRSAENETATTTVAGTTEDAPPANEVAGAMIETVVVDDMFVAVKNSDVVEAESTSTSVIEAPEGSLVGRVLASPQTALSYAYLIFGILVVLALALDTMIEIRRRHPMHIVYALLLWILIIGLLYAGGAYVFPDVIVV
ncbi:MAG: hypothetical protein A2408_04005 [Candidatus Yonathbacteria bacterium RIFOXYC1_FULL_52_10]|uniref:SCP domain-containing protein n=1 Tax=Candidatus Yonathbacteria bacterium RIFOXYD1_FULL_52_36 TaxID=1802730 RepID=A0A1G2SML7_9BACT|nr:MAG: hypothetical protein A2408_04005 [Candidatus Yonathbacteria bacterium RIFOXYC1_FULL_52_10]OHA86194.1 MAG: hypothetical protein A2591_03880 [Candidatus Yonathbacteria bacterium RIFOXYD1_FULL_52_36]